MWRLSDNAIIPTQSTNQSIVLDIHPSDLDLGIQLNSMKTLEIDISIEPPKDTYIRIPPPSGLVHENPLHVLARVIDVSYRESIKLMLQNLGTKPATIKHGQRTAYLMYGHATIQHLENYQPRQYS